MGRQLRGLRQRRGATEASATVEFAIILPVLLMLTLGIIDGSILFFKWQAIGQASRDGVRAVIDQPADDYADYSGLKAAAMVFSAVSPADIERVVIYKATIDSDGDGNPMNNPPPAACLTGTTGVDGVCNVYTGADLNGTRPSYAAAGKFASWPGVSRDVWADDTDTDYIGVYIAARVTPPVGVLGGTRIMSQFTVGRIEPQATNPPLT